MVNWSWVYIVNLWVISLDELQLPWQPVLLPNKIDGDGNATTVSVLSKSITVAIVLLVCLTSDFFITFQVVGLRKR